MKIPFFDLSRQYVGIADEVERAVVDTMRSTQYVEGKAVREFESSVSEYLGVKHAITCGNGTDALRIALKSCGVGRGDEVVTSPFTFFATAEAICQVGATPVFVDVDDENFNIVPDEIRKRITFKTKAILPVHIFGTPADMDEINSIAGEYNIPVIEDACQAIGSMYRGKAAGTLGTMGCFSFYPTKNLGAFGDGGMITTDSDEISVIVRSMKAHSAGKGGALAFKYMTGREVPELDDINGSGDALYDPCKYYNYFIGENSRLDSMQAAVLSVKLKHLEEYNLRRCEIAERYKNEIVNDKIKTPVVRFSDRQSCFHQYAVLVDDKEGFIKYLNDNEIGAGNFYPVPLHRQRAFESLWVEDEKLPVSESVCKRTVCLPIFPELSDDEVTFIIEICNKY